MSQKMLINHPSIRFSFISEYSTNLIYGVLVRIVYLKDGNYYNQSIMYQWNYMPGKSFGLFRALVSETPGEVTKLPVLINADFYLNGCNDYRRKCLKRAVIEDDLFKSLVLTKENFNELPQRDVNVLFNSIPTSRYKELTGLYEER